jgi:hypothetical protein
MPMHVLQKDTVRSEGTVDAKRRWATERLPEWAVAVAEGRAPCRELQQRQRL